MIFYIPKKLKEYELPWQRFHSSPLCRPAEPETSDDSKSMPLFSSFRKVLFWLCLPCFLLAGLMVYVTLAVCLSMAPTHRPYHPQSILAINTMSVKFTAPGTTESPKYAAKPQGAFWRDRMDANKTGLWNRLQYKLDLWNSNIFRSVKARPQGVQMVASVRGRPCAFNLTSVETAMPGFYTLPLHIREFVLRMMCRDFPLLTDQPRLCHKETGRPPFLLLAIKSQDEHYEQRQVIRETWGQQGQLRGRRGRGGLVRRLFLLGRGGGSPNRTQEERLKQESEQHGDLLRWGFRDSFFNLTLKDVLFWGWLARHCSRARFIFKGDDDVFVRTPALLDYLQAQLDREEQKAAAGLTPDETLQNFLVGDVIQLARPILSKEVKYYIPEHLYTGTYPTYAGGGGVVYSGALALRLLKVSQRVALFPIDDIYVGMCLERLGVVPTHEPAFLTFDFPEGEEEESPCAYHSILLVHKRSPEAVRRLWAEILVPPPECLNTTLRVNPTHAPPKHMAHKQKQTQELDIMDFI
ncbi:hypothetical protein AALO_G00193360 [Alosa alosa]|uniref:Hexosyltransferase n=1 Tax=Alosa alosa TaxID=278164 RepID=A0AAV6GAE3_9TELE|nr:N-acetyllactosaminide beta-1,3-N-acetylglucosaminyltransferase 2 [Alosa alosa]XP_048118421.1 N-acetyllactosaminide beta-1,3-N-acetylglucosaminyltransferase 2 [Alosa alosa]KAG5270501.1 hypothetical protein AALO_G00193360 [Alosa alosa]